MLHHGNRTKICFDVEIVLWKGDWNEQEMKEIEDLKPELISK